MISFESLSERSVQTSNIVHKTRPDVSGVRAKGGSSANPGISFASDSNSGIFNPGSNQIGLVVGGNTRLFVDEGTQSVTVNGALNVNSNIIPSTNATLMIGTSNMHFKEAWIDTLHISSNTLYLGDTPVLGTDQDSIAIRADVDQSINLKTSGLGTTNVTSTKGVNVTVSGLNSVVDLQSSGAGGRVVLGATTEVAMNAPTTTIGSNLTVQGNLTVNGTQFTANVQTVEVQDNIIVLNKGQVGSGVSAGAAGISIDRGDAASYQLLFNEVSDKFEIGPIGNLSPIATEAYALPTSGGTLTGPLIGTNASFDTITTATGGTTSLTLRSPFSTIINSDYDNDNSSNDCSLVDFQWRGLSKCYITPNGKFLPADGGDTPRTIGSSDIRWGGIFTSNVDAYDIVGNNITASSIAGTCISSVIDSTNSNVAASSAAMKAVYDIASAYGGTNALFDTITTATGGTTSLTLRSPFSTIINSDYNKNNAGTDCSLVDFQWRGVTKCYITAGGGFLPGNGSYRTIGTSDVRWGGFFASNLDAYDIVGSNIVGSNLSVGNLSVNQRSFFAPVEFTNIYPFNDGGGRALLLSGGSGGAQAKVLTLERYNNYDIANFYGTGNLNVRGTVSGGGADYAEYFEWEDGNPAKEDRVGHTVTFVAGKSTIRIATPSDAPETIIGVVSANPTIIGNDAWSTWQGMYLRDDYDRVKMGDVQFAAWTDAEGKEHRYRVDLLPEGVTIPADAEYITEEAELLNPDYNKSIPYVQRKDRPEWVCIGLMGKLRVRTSSPVNSNWILIQNITNDVKEWLVK